MANNIHRMRALIEREAVLRKFWGARPFRKVMGLWSLGNEDPFKPVKVTTGPADEPLHYEVLFKSEPGEDGAECKVVLRCPALEDERKLLVRERLERGGEEFKELRYRIKHDWYVSRDIGHILVAVNYPEGNAVFMQDSLYATCHDPTKNEAVFRTYEGALARLCLNYEQGALAAGDRLMDEWREAYED